MISRLYVGLRSLTVAEALAMIVSFALMVACMYHYNLVEDAPWLAAALAVIWSFGFQSTIYSGIVRARSRALNTMFVMCLQELVKARRELGQEGPGDEVQKKIHEFFKGPETLQ